MAGQNFFAKVFRFFPFQDKRNNFQIFKNFSKIWFFGSLILMFKIIYWNMWRPAEIFKQKISHNLANNAIKGSIYDIKLKIEGQFPHTALNIFTRFFLYIKDLLQLILKIYWPQIKNFWVIWISPRGATYIECNQE